MQRRLLCYDERIVRSVNDAGYVGRWEISAHAMAVLILSNGLRNEPVQGQQGF